QEVSALLGVKYRKESNGVDFSHSYMITLLDEGGVIRKQRIGTSEPTSVLVEALSAD
ncbi:MAG: hypothetical protein IT285_01680, partial [Bdellovibrionales bacterium]|nr:hypothetical protein [Bdellovibrionales bacterium]